MARLESTSIKPAVAQSASIKPTIKRPITLLSPFINSRHAYDLELILPEHAAQKGKLKDNTHYRAAHRAYKFTFLFYSLHIQLEPPSPQFFLPSSKGR